MSDQGKANYEGYRKMAGRPGVSAGPLPEYEQLPLALQYAWDNGADAVEAWLAAAPVDEDAPGNEPIGAAGIDRFVKLAEGFDLRYREYSDAANVNENLDDSRAQRAIGVAFKKCGAQLRHVIGDLASPTAEDFDRAAEELVERYALVEQMGYRQVIGTVREITFLGKAVLEVTALDTGAVRIIGGIGEGLYQLTWMTRDQAERAIRTGAHSVAAQRAAIEADYASWDDPSTSQLAAEEDREADEINAQDADDDGERDTARRMDALDEAARLEAGQ